MIKRSAPYCIIVGFYYLNIAEEYISLLKETKKNKFVTSFFFLQSKYVWGSGRSIERIKLNDRLNKDIRLQPLGENTLRSLIYSRNLFEGNFLYIIEQIRNFLFSYLLHVTLRKSLDCSQPDILGKPHMSRILNYFVKTSSHRFFWCALLGLLVQQDLREVMFGRFPEYDRKD